MSDMFVRLIVLFAACSKREHCCCSVYVLLDVALWLAVAVMFCTSFMSMTMQALSEFPAVGQQHPGCEDALSGAVMQQKSSQVLKQV